MFTRRIFGVLILAFLSGLFLCDTVAFGQESLIAARGIAQCLETMRAADDISCDWSIVFTSPSKTTELAETFKNVSVNLYGKLYYKSGGKFRIDCNGRITLPEKSENVRSLYISNGSYVWYKKYSLLDVFTIDLNKIDTLAVLNDKTLFEQLAKRFIVESTAVDGTDEGTVFRLTVTPAPAFFAEAVRSAPEGRQWEARYLLARMISRCDIVITERDNGAFLDSVTILNDLNEPLLTIILNNIAVNTKLKDSFFEYTLGNNEKEVDETEKIRDSIRHWLDQ